MTLHKLNVFVQEASQVKMNQVSRTALLLSNFKGYVRLLDRLANFYAHNIHAELFKSTFTKIDLKIPGSIESNERSKSNNFWI